MKTLYDRTPKIKAMRFRVFSLLKVMILYFTHAIKIHTHTHMQTHTRTYNSLLQVR